MSRESRARGGHCQIALDGRIAGCTRVEIEAHVGSNDDDELGVTRIGREREVDVLDAENAARPLVNNS